MNNTETPTAALTVTALARLMTEVSERALDSSQRMFRETDAVLYGKLVQLEVIAEMVWGGNDVLSYEEEKAMDAAIKVFELAWKAVAPVEQP
jgi:hypothetical protein